MKLTVYGAAQTVTGSKHLIEINGKRLLLECGLFQGKRQNTYDYNLNFDFDPASLDAVILSHAHIDHSGNLPNLVKSGYDGPIYATHATRDLADIMLKDSGHIHEYDVKYVNKKRKRKGLPSVDPLYTIQDAVRTIPHFRQISYGMKFQPVPGVTARFIEAGHILGSAAILLDLQENGRMVRLWFSGDIGRPDKPLLRDPVLPGGYDVDVLMMECTYGDRPHDDINKAFEEFKDMVNRTIQRGGKVIIPAFSVGRTQTLVYCLNKFMSEGSIPKVPVFVDSPLAVAASEIYRRHPECFDQETWDFISEHRHPALDFDQLTYTRSVDESKALNYRDDPMVIISASGMVEAGRILHHVKNNIDDEHNTILIVSWMAPHTLGRRLADREREVRIFGEKYYRRAQVETINGLSAHAGQGLLVDYARSAASSAKDIILVHGEEDAADALIEKLSAYENIPPIHFPNRKESFEL
ncbi:MAG: MBL fold metallo-hydrolase [Chloroflexota bacterium]|jgi:metallo-beta-lactamase family protein|nr:MBL fold metallo-hydrolase [Chloroflexota bacterium]